MTVGDLIDIIGELDDSLLVVLQNDDPGSVNYGDFYAPTVSVRPGGAQIVLLNA